MSATPMRLEDALRFNGYTIDQADSEPVEITTDQGVIHVPAMRLSALTWRRAGDPTPSDSFYLAALPTFDPAYQPVLLSHILDRFSTRRLSYDMPDMFGLAVRRWLNKELGPTSVWNRLYRSTAVNLPLTTQDATTELVTNDKARDAYSDFPQGQLSRNTDYSTSATDRVADATGTTTYQGRLGASVMSLLAEQRAAFLNVDIGLLAAMDSLFLGVWDQDERGSSLGAPVSSLGFLPGRW